MLVEGRDLGSMFLRSLKLNRLLSFGPDSEAVELRPLNVLIGPNGSGKSNFIEAIALLAAAPKDIARAFREGGSSWIWQGEPDADGEIVAETNFGPNSEHRVLHTMRLVNTSNGVIVRENIKEGYPVENGIEVELIFEDTSQSAIIYGESKPKEIPNRDVLQSILAQIKGPDYLTIGALGYFYGSIRIYREFTFGRRSAARRPQPADLPTDHLMESSENLGLILNKFRLDVPTKKALIEELRNVFEGITDFSVQVQAGTAQIFLEEEHWTIPATRLSDGTIRWLALLAILLDPKPPPLVCIEEPELGLHPDLMNPLARILKSASERMQIIITTHSEALVDAFRKTPEDIIVCERPAGSTTMRRLDREQLGEWLEEYSLAELWSRGMIGGTRW